MSEYRDTLERELERLQPPRIHFDQLARRRDRKRRDQRIRAGVLGLAIAIGVGWWGAHAIRSSTPTPGDDSMPTPTPTELRRGGEIIVFEPLGTGPGWDLAAQDPETREVRKIVETDGIVDCPDRARCRSFVKVAEWSSDDRWVAFDVSFGGLDLAPHGPCGPTAGVWVKSALGAPRQLTTPCQATPGAEFIEELWAWSPVGARLAYARVDGETDELFVIDPSDGRRTSLGMADGNMTFLAGMAWSPDGTRIAYADGGSVYEVVVDGGERSLLADSFNDVVDIDWSPDGTQIVVTDQGRYRLQVMNADGSDLHLLLEGEDACCETEWSPLGDRILYQLSNPEDKFGAFDSEVWTVSPDGSNRIKVFDSNGCDMGEIAHRDALPVWAPNGTQVAYNACGVWVVANADGTGEAQPIDELMHDSWGGGGFTQFPG
jgi:Tol biopolymer transport system component